MAKAKKKSSTPYSRMRRNRYAANNGIFLPCSATNFCRILVNSVFIYEYGKEF